LDVGSSGLPGKKGSSMDLGSGDKTLSGPSKSKLGTSEQGATQANKSSP